MTSAARQVTQLGLQLVPRERERVAEKLWRSLEFKSPKEFDDFWQPEIERRLKDYHEGRDRGKPVEEVMVRLRRHYAPVK